MSDDALSQFTALVYRLDSVGPRPRDIDVYLEHVASLDAVDAWTCLNQLRMWLASFPAEPSAAFIGKIVEMAVNYRTPNPPTLHQIYKAVGAEHLGPSAKSMRLNELDEEDDDLEGGDQFDAAGWLDKAGEELDRDDAGGDSMELFLFKTAALVLANLRSLQGLQLVPLAAVSFFFSSIEHGSSLHVQRCAAYCAGILSAEHLPVVLDQFFERMKQLPEKKFRWLLYQQATQLFAFGVGSQQQAEATVAYLEAVAKSIKRIDRGKLRGAICSSLYRIFGRIMGSDDGAMAQRQWATFASNLRTLAKQYEEAYASIYATVSKWAKKAKHALPCWRLMVRMSVVGNQTFFVDKRRDHIFPILLSASKKCAAPPARGPPAAPRTPLPRRPDGPTARTAPAPPPTRAPLRPTRRAGTAASAWPTWPSTSSSCPSSWRAATWRASCPTRRSCCS